MKIDYLIDNVNLVTFAQADKQGSLLGLGMGMGEDDYGSCTQAVVAIADNKIVFAGQLPGSTEDWLTNQGYDVKQRLDAGGQWLTPGLVDCHTHLVFGGNRAQEFEWRLRGESYEDIARKGGGIVSSVSHTRELSEEALLKQSEPRLLRLLEEGVTTVEIKSGYGLDTETELKMLRVARELGRRHAVTVKTTFLGAHAVPPEFKQRSHGQQCYIDYVCQDMLPEVARQELADAVDVFCEGIGFTPQQCEQVFQTAAKLGLPIKGHVEQLSDLKGAVLAAQYHALSVDHIEYLAEADVEKLQGSVAVLLPAAFYCLNEKQRPPIAALRQHNIPMAVATDLNPGTAPLASLLTAMNQACILFGLTPAEALKGATLHGAKALGLKDVGGIQAGMAADLALWDIQHPAELAYGVNFYRPTQVWHQGRLRNSNMQEAI
jgi:imidazolonepropionase